MKLLHSVLLFIGMNFALGATAADGPFEAAFRTSLLKSFNEASGKILALAEAIPEANYDWRPMEKVTSVREVLGHVTSTNFSLGERLGGKPPVGSDRKTLAERLKTKTEAIAVTKLSMDYIREILATIPATELLPEVNVFCSKAPKLRVALLPVDHAHEHLGQLIAYARTNRIVPPWSK